MRSILKVILFLISLFLSFLTDILMFLLRIGTVLLSIVMVIFIIGSLVAFIKGSVGMGIWGLFFAFLCSPYGLPVIGATVIAFIEFINDKIKAM